MPAHPAMLERLPMLGMPLLPPKLESELAKLPMLGMPLLPPPMLGMPLLPMKLVSVDRSCFSSRPAQPLGITAIAHIASC